MYEACSRIGKSALISFSVKIFVLDMCLESADEKGFEKLREEFEVFLIDHHPTTNELKNTKNILKTKTLDCSALAIYEMGVKNKLIDEKKLKWLINATIISEYGFKDDKNLKFLQNSDEKITIENAFESPLAEFSKIIGGALIYFNSKKMPLVEIYNLIKKKDLDSLKKFDEEVKTEIEKHLKEFEKNSEFYPEKNLHIYYFNSKFSITSTLSTIISSKDFKGVFIFMKDSESELGKIKISARCQSNRVDMNFLMRKSVEGLENSVAGGHVPAAGATIMKKDLEKFKQNIFHFLKP